MKTLSMSSLKRLGYSLGNSSQSLPRRWLRREVQTLYSSSGLA